VHSAAVRAAGAPAAQEKTRPVINVSLYVGCGSCIQACPGVGTFEMAGGKAILAHPEPRVASHCSGYGLSGRASGFALRSSALLRVLFWSTRFCVFGSEGIKS
jgi:hypothetical protein